MQTKSRIFVDSELETLKAVQRRNTLAGRILLVVALAFYAYQMSGVLLRNPSFISYLTEDLLVVFFLPFTLATIFYKRWPLACSTLALGCVLWTQVSFYSFKSLWVIGLIFGLTGLSLIVATQLQKSKRRLKDLSAL